MNDGILAWYFLGSIALLILFRWAHRCWGKAVLATVFAPLILVPMAFVAYMGVGVLLRGINSVLEFAHWDFSRTTIAAVAGITTGAILMLLLAYYCRDQRQVARVDAGPWLGVRYRVPEPRGNMKRRIK